MSFTTESTNLHRKFSFSEPDLKDHIEHFNRFSIKQPHQYIAIDDLKFFRRRQGLPDIHTRSNLCLYNRSDSDNKDFSKLALANLSNYKSEYQEQYHPYSPKTCRSCRSFPTRYPENIHVGFNSKEIEPEYRTTNNSYAMDNKILPNEGNASTNKPAVVEHSSKDIDSLNKYLEKKSNGDRDAHERQECHLQQRKFYDNSSTFLPSTEYQHQFVSFPLEKAHSIPQISWQKTKDAFIGISEYNANFKMHDSYSKSAPIRNTDNLQLHIPIQNSIDVSRENCEQLQNSPREEINEIKLIKAGDHRQPRGEFDKYSNENHFGLRDSQIKDHISQRKKDCETISQLQGKLELNAGNRNSCLEFSRSRSKEKKSLSSFRLSETPTASVKSLNNSTSPRREPRKYKSNSPRHYANLIGPTIELTATPEYRRAHYNYQLRERTPPRKFMDPSANGQAKCNSGTRTVTKNFKTCPSQSKNLNTMLQKRLTPRQRHSVTLSDKRDLNFNRIAGMGSPKRIAKFGRRSTGLNNELQNHRHNQMIGADNAKYSPSARRNKSQESFVVLKEPCKRTNWMKTSWYDS